ncbi:hypothetical protein [Pseudomonas reactans]|uniref:hypothetical protein n=1 Tax=Pseudomonas reactans TaxID=117680 RepID=UPI0015A2B3CB|nr:hypothetical protein [Pseudomonas reactans]NWA64537.1 hypothetical protein [Pseudomonas reactans]
MINDSEIIFLMSSLSLLALGAFSVGVWFYIIFFRMSEVVSCLERSLVVQGRCEFLNAGLVGNFYILSGVSGVLVFPQRSIERGELDLEDYRQFPTSLKFWIVSSTSAAIVLALVGVGMVLAIKFLGWPASSL